MVWGWMMITDAEERIVLFHIKKCMKEGKNYFKSRDISEDIGNSDITSNRVAAILHIFSKKQMWKFRISKYSKSGSRSTWKAEVI